MWGARSGAGPLLTGAGPQGEAWVEDKGGGSQRELQRNLGKLGKRSEKMTNPGTGGNSG